jgi:hypothetical protein
MREADRTATVDLSGVHGWDVVSADAVRIGRVHGLSEDGRFLEVELTPTLPGATGQPGRPQPGEVLPGNPNTTRLTDPDPTVAETEIYGHYNTGARQHAGEMPAAVPRDRPRDRDVPDEVPRLVHIPVEQARVHEGDDRVFLDSLRSQEVESLPRRSST